MFTITIDPVIWQFDHFALRWYDLIVLIAMQVGIWLVAGEVERKGFKKEDFYRLRARLATAVQSNGASSNPRNAA